jgi:hypothetical protein
LLLTQRWGKRIRTLGPRSRKAVTLDLIADLTDQAIVDRLIGTMFRKAEGRYAGAFQADGRAINEKVRLCARVGAALIAAREGSQDPFRRICFGISSFLLRPAAEPTPSTIMAEARGSGRDGRE